MKENLFDENEARANVLAAKAFLFIAFICAACWVFVTFLFWKDELTTRNILLVPAFFFTLSGIISIKLKGKGSWLKYLMIGVLFEGVLIVAFYSSPISYLVLSVPLLLSIGYFIPSFTITTAVISSILMLFYSLLKGNISPNLFHVLDERFILLPQSEAMTLEKGRLYNTFFKYGFDDQAYTKTALTREFLPAMIVFTVLSVIAIYTSSQGRRLIIENGVREKEKADLRNSLELNQSKMVLSQIKPHFIFNVLNTIRELCVEDSQQAESAIDQFSGYLRDNLEFIDQNHLIPFKTEMDYVQRYVNLEKLRFGDRIHYEENFETTDFNVPPLTIQPIVENAIKHGILKKVEGGNIKVSTKAVDQEIIITIQDNGVGFIMKDPDSRPHVGIKNVRTRLSGLLGAKLDISVGQGNGTTVTIHIPVKG